MINSVAKASTGIQFNAIQTLDSIYDSSVELSSRRRAQAAPGSTVVLVYGISFSLSITAANDKLDITGLSYIKKVQDAFQDAIQDGLFDVLLRSEAASQGTRFLLEATLTGVDAIELETGV